ncbi:sensor histidine kinase [Flavobacterium cucumis]|uniref:Signal transduction histidine kinase internal region domain-containing protein n=1 Tax=Flavobacterium cucumis TaxID=416016 RepID=A0A1M7ZYN7_9FLAO|nr:sensor histidine kinase [Flavobacterium cucumis]SHO73978.1 hypothetical protein SAMN05443547_2357 [Flavobacterium cucumis]
MQKLLSKIKTHRYFLSFVLLFAYVQSVQERFLHRNEFDVYLFTPEAAVAQFLSACFLFLIIRYLLTKWKKSVFIGLKKLVYVLFASTLIYYVAMLFLGVIVALIFDTFDRNFNATTLVLNLFMYALNALIYGSFYLTYFYYNNNIVQQEALSQYNQALAESKILQLKSQINPHFLFNNLNVLDQLIAEDKTMASDFLNNFAELYRFVLEVSDKKLIPLEEEIAFAQKYFHLMQQKFGNAYLLEFVIKNKSGSIVPMTLQLLLENAIKHNVGSLESPIKIRIEIDTNIQVSNPLKPKMNSKLVSGKALKNLSTQYMLLCDHEIQIKQEETQFLVTIPILNNSKHD